MPNKEEMLLKDALPANQKRPPEADLSMLEDSLAMTPWERILANDDIVNFGDSLSVAMEKRNAKSR